MRSLLSFLTTLAAVSVGTTALEASLFTFATEIDGRSQDPSLVSSVTLQQLLELRAGSSTLSTLEGSDDSTVELFSRLSGPSKRLFGAPPEDGRLTAVTVILEGLGDGIDSLLPSEFHSGLVTSAFAADSTGDEFLDILLAPRPNSRVDTQSKHCSVYAASNNGSDAQENAKLCLPGHSEYQILAQVVNEGLLSHASICESWVDERQGSVVLRLAFETDITVKASSALVDSLKPLFSGLHSLALSGKVVTAAVLPIGSATHNLSRSKRASDVSQFTSPMGSSKTQRMAVEEQVFSLAPVCHASNSTCNQATNTCSGHGVCYKKSGSEREAASGDCYSCRCHETYVKNEDGTQRRVQWGGSACQKKDISSPFFLIAGVTVTIIVVVTAAIGMLFSVGNTELPGVISAGVGARTQK
ncbi:hypothetical protein BJX70DRAFT_376609 [Aspergillus crustosus]